MKEMKEECFEMFLVPDMEIGYFISLSGRHRPHLLVKSILPRAEEMVLKTDHCVKAQGQRLAASASQYVLFGGKKSKIQLRSGRIYSQSNCIEKTP